MELREEREKMIEALEPFAELAIYGEEHFPEAHDTDEIGVAIRDIRRALTARALIAKTGGGDAIAKAVEAEIEACAQLIEAFGKDRMPFTISTLAEAIRARKEPTP